ncbi:hypothetical protein CR513_51141, partial [Mucuna pruriens]
MVVKSANPEQHIQDLEEIFAQVHKYNMQLNLDKYVFRVQGGNHYQHEKPLEREEGTTIDRSVSVTVTVLTKGSGEDLTFLLTSPKLGRSLPSLQKVPHLTPSLGQTYRGPRPLPVPRSVGTRHECGGCPRIGETPRPCVLHQQNTSRNKKPLLDDRKIGLGPDHLSSAPQALIPLPHNNRS